MLPIILSSILVTLVFLVPVESGEKLSYILTVLLTIAVFLTIIGDTLPAISLTTSVLGSTSVIIIPLLPRQCYKMTNDIQCFCKTKCYNCITFCIAIICITFSVCITFCGATPQIVFRAVNQRTFGPVDHPSPVILSS